MHTYSRISQYPQGGGLWETKGRTAWSDLCWNKHTLSVTSWISFSAHSHYGAHVRPSKPDSLPGPWNFSVYSFSPHQYQISPPGQSEMFCFSCLGLRVDGWPSFALGARPLSLDACHAQADNGKCHFPGLLHLSKATIISSFYLNIPASDAYMYDHVGVDASRKLGISGLQNRAYKQCRTRPLYTCN